MIIAQLWAFANDVYTVEQGKRLFAIVGFGASLGAIAGSFATGQLVKRLRSLSVHARRRACCSASACCSRTSSTCGSARTRRRAADGAKPRRALDGRQSASSRAGRSGFALVFTDRYLLLIGAAHAGLQPREHHRRVHPRQDGGGPVHRGARRAVAPAGLDEKKVIGEFYGNFFTLVNMLSALIQAFVVSRVLKYFGVRVALLVLPVVALDRLRLDGVRAAARRSSAAPRSRRTRSTTRCRTPRATRSTCPPAARRSTRPSRPTTRSSCASATCSRRGSCSRARPGSGSRRESSRW